MSKPLYPCRKCRNAKDDPLRIKKLHGFFVEHWFATLCLLHALLYCIPPTSSDNPPMCSWAFWGAWKGYFEEHDTIKKVDALFWFSTFLEKQTSLSTDQNTPKYNICNLWRPTSIRYEYGMDTNIHQTWQWKVPRSIFIYTANARCLGLLLLCPGLLNHVTRHPPSLWASSTVTLSWFPVPRPQTQGGFGGEIILVWP